MSIRLEGISRTFGEFNALKDISLDVRPAEFLALLGPSGSGKTTLLRIMAGLDSPSAGSVFFDGEDVTGISVADRHVGFVFQHYALFKHMTVADNIAFGLQVKKRRHRPAKRVIADRVRELLDVVQLDGLGKRYPAQLSGGQRQRVALARALAVEPRLLLLDEPFGALDAKVRKDLRRWLRELHERLHITSIFVTHDQEEALELADRVVVMNGGEIEQVATPIEITRDPASAFVFDFVSDANVLPVTVENGSVRYGAHRLLAPEGIGWAGEAKLCFRPHEVTLVNDGAPALPMTVLHTRLRNGRLWVEGRLPGDERILQIVVPEAMDITPDQALPFVPSRMKLYPDRA